MPNPTRTLTPEDGTVICVHCEKPYEWDRNLLDGEWLWVCRCAAKCRHANPKPEARFERKGDNDG